MDIDELTDVIVKGDAHDSIDDELNGNKEKNAVEVKVMSNIEEFKLAMENYILEVDQINWENKDYSLNLNIDFIFELTESMINSICNKYMVADTKLDHIELGPPHFTKGNWI
eukprot:4130729-Ditylum_brightwellii.AAC.1